MKRFARILSLLALLVGTTSVAQEGVISLRHSAEGLSSGHGGTELMTGAVSHHSVQTATHRRHQVASINSTQKAMLYDPTSSLGGYGGLYSPYSYYNPYSSYNPYYSSYAYSPYSSYSPYYSSYAYNNPYSYNPYYSSYAYNPYSYNPYYSSYAYSPYSYNPYSSYSSYPYYGSYGSYSPYYGGLGYSYPSSYSWWY